MTLLSGGANCIRYILLAFNLLFVITGIILISVGVTVAGVYRNYETFLLTKFFSIPTLLVVTGSFIFIIAFFGCFGAMKENYCMILTFSVLLGIIFIFELAGGISGYVLRNDASELIQEKLTEILPSYNKTGSEPVTYMWDKVQREFKCCGIQGYSDWIKPLDGAIPLSCCNIPNGFSEFKCNAENENKTLNRKGCLTFFGEYISSHAVSLGAAGVILAIIQFAGIFFACYVAREIKIRNGGTGFF